MLKSIIILCTVLVFCTCAGTDNSNKVSSSPAASASKGNKYWTSLPESGELVFIGVSGSQIKQETEIAMACEDAARKVSMYHGLLASYVSVQSIGSGFMDYYVDSDIWLDYDRDIEKYLDKLVFDPERDVVKIDGTVFVRFTYPASFPGKITYPFARNPNGSPEWMNRPPREIDGFMAGVGFARKQSRQRDTITKSSESAAAALVSQINSSMSSKEVSAVNEKTTVIQQQSIGKLSNFLVLEIWIDPESDAVWTLAIAKSAN